MPYVIVEYCENYYCKVGDPDADPELMRSVGAERDPDRGQVRGCYHTSDPARVVLDRLDRLGYKTSAHGGHF